MKIDLFHQAAKKFIYANEDRRNPFMDENHAHEGYRTKVRLTPRHRRAFRLACSLASEGLGTAVCFCVPINTFYLLDQAGLTTWT